MEQEQAPKRPRVADAVSLASGFALSHPLALGHALALPTCRYPKRRVRARRDDVDVAVSMLSGVAHGADVSGVQCGDDQLLEVVVNVLRRTHAQSQVNEIQVSGDVATKKSGGSASAKQSEADHSDSGEGFGDVSKGFRRSGESEDDDDWCSLRSPQPPQKFSQFEKFVSSFADTFADEDVAIPLCPKRSKYSRSFLCWKVAVRNVDEATRFRRSLAEVAVATWRQVLSIVMRQIDESMVRSVHNPGNAKLSEEGMVSFCKALEASILALEVMSHDGISREVVLEDVVEKIVALLKLHSTRSILPVVDPGFRNSESAASYWEKARKLSKAAFDRIPVLLARLDRFLGREHTQDSSLMSALAACFSLLGSSTATGIESIQVACVPVVVTCFRRYAHFRGNILDEVVSLLSVMERPPKNSLRHFRVHSGDTTAIQTCSALAVLLVQAVSASTLTDASVPSSLAVADADTLAQLFQEGVASPLELSARHSRLLIAKLMQHCMRSGESAMARRAALADFIADLQTLAFAPSWPAAGVLLHDTMLYLGHLISRPPNEQGGGGNSRVVAAELLGFCLAFVHRQMTVAQAGAVVLDNSEPSEPDWGTNREQMGCLCGKGRDRGFMLDCDECHRWFHGECVGVTSSNASDWTCRPCWLRRRVRFQHEAMLKTVASFSHYDNESEICFSTDDVIQQLLVKFLTFHGQRSLEALSGRQLLLVRWLSGLGCERDSFDASGNGQSEAGELLDMYLDQLPKPSATFSRGALVIFATQWNVESALADSDWERNDSLLSAEEGSQLVRTLALSQPLFTNFRMLLALLVRGLNEKHTSMRARVIKSIASVVEAGPSVLRHPELVKAVRLAIQDKASSVREAAVDLIGRYMLGEPLLAEQYYPLLAPRARDVGLSVRKRVIRILRDICLAQPQHSQYTSMCVTLISQTGREESINALVLKTAHQMWFKNYVAASSRRVDASRFTSAFRRICLRFVEVVAELESDEWLVQLVRSVITGKDEAKADVVKMFDVCADMCSCIVQSLLKADKSAHRDDSTKKLSALAMLKALHVFCQARPALLASHAFVLQPYLKPAPELQPCASQPILCTVTSMLRQVLPTLESPRRSFIKDLDSDLRALILKQNMAVLRNAIPCLCTLAIITEDASSPFQLLKSFCGFLYRHREMIIANCDGIAKALLRSLFASALLVKCFDFDSAGKPLMPVAQAKLLCADAGLKSSDIVTDAVLALLKCYAASRSEVLRRTAVQSLFFFFCRRPAMIMSSASVIEAALSEDAGPLSQAQTLRALAQFLVAEDDRLVSLQETSREKSAVAATVSDHADSGVIAGMLQTLLPRLLQLGVSNSAPVRIAFLSLSGLLLSQRLVNPSQCVPTLVALCTDKQEGAADSALHQLTELAEMYPAMMRSGAVQGIHIAFALNVTTAQVHHVFTGDTSANFKQLGRFYKLLETNRCDISRLLCALVDSCNVGRAETTWERMHQRTQMVAFVGAGLAAFTYSHDEPIHLVRHLNRLIVSIGAPLDSRVAAVFRDIKRGHMPGSAGLTQLAVDCELARQISVLLLLKTFLKEAYNLTPQHFADIISMRRSQVSLSRRADVCFTLHHVLPSTPDNSIQELYRQYAFFQNLLHRDVEEDPEATDESEDEDDAEDEAVELE